MDARWTIHGDVMWAGEGFRGWCVVAVCLIEVVTSHFCRLSLSPCRRYITVNHTRGYRRRIPESGACIRQEHSRDVARGVGIWRWIHPSLSGVKILISAESGEVNMHQIVSLLQKKTENLSLKRHNCGGGGAWERESYENGIPMGIGVGIGMGVGIYLSIYLSIYLKSQDYGDVGAEAQQGRLTM